jgi:outer membrane protein assembly factor BamB
MTVRLAPIVALLLAFLAGSAQARPPGEPERRPIAAETVTGDWLAYGHDAQLTNDAPQAAITSATAGSLHELWRRGLDGAVIASPLAVGGVVYVATEAGSVYALAAGTGAIVWARSFPLEDSGVCGTWGISSTGAVDLVRGLLYVADADGFVHALSLADGAEAWRVRITDRPATEYVWGGLRLVGGRLYAPVASYCDERDAQGRSAEGRIEAVDLDTHAVTAVFDTVPGPDNLGGVWGWGGVSVDPDSTALWTAVGNSQVTDPACACTIDDAGYGDAVVELTQSLVPLEWDRPASVPARGDDDFGAAPALFDVPGCGPYAAANNKDGYLYIWRRDRFQDGPVAELGIGTRGAPFLGEPSWSSAQNVLFDASTNVPGDAGSLGDGVTAIRFTRECHARVVWQSVTGRGTQPPPLVLGDVLFAAGGSGGWSVIDAITGLVLWRYETAQSTFAPPIAVGGRIFAGDAGGVVHAFGAAG